MGIAGSGVVIVAISSTSHSSDPTSRASVPWLHSRSTADNSLLRGSGSSKLTHRDNGAFEYAVGVGWMGTGSTGRRETRIGWEVRRTWPQGNVLVAVRAYDISKFGNEAVGGRSEGTMSSKRWEAALPAPAGCSCSVILFSRILSALSMSRFFFTCGTLR